MRYTLRTETRRKMMVMTVRTTTNSWTTSCKASIPMTTTVTRTVTTPLKSDKEGGGLALVSAEDTQWVYGYNDESEDEQ